MLRLITVALLFCMAISGGIVDDVRKAASAGEFSRAEQLIEYYRAGNGITPETVLAISWLGREALAAGEFEEADHYAAESRKLALKLAESRNLGKNKQLRGALGASIEVQAQALAAQGSLSEAIAFLNDELKRWGDTLLATRIRKNINLLSLEGKPPPPLDVSEYLGPKPPPLGDLKGKVVLLFFWAHWCPDCKYEAPILGRLQREYGGKGLLIIGPTQLYGYAARGRDATPAEERNYIDQARHRQYGAVKDMSAPLGKENFVEYGSSTVPTLVLIDRDGIVRLYHPGEMPYEELEPKVAALF